MRYMLNFKDLGCRQILSIIILIPISSILCVFPLYFPLSPVFGFTCSHMVDVSLVALSSLKVMSAPPPFLEIERGKEMEREEREILM